QRGCAVGEGRLQVLVVRAAGSGGRPPSQVVKMQLVLDSFQLSGARRGQEALESRRKSAQLSNRFHTGNVESAWILRYPIRRLNLARSCAGLLSSRRFSRSPLAPVEGRDLHRSSSDSPDRSRSPAACRCITRQNWP